jgi:hypothetical protein
MATVSRRSLFKRSAAIGGASLLLGGGAQLLAEKSAQAVTTAPPAPPGPPPFSATTVLPSNPRYTQMVTAFNNRWVGSPQSVQLVGTTSDVQNAVQTAVSAGRQFAVQGGATLGDIYETLYRGYGVTLPGGHCPSTGIGGHATGGGHGMLSRKFGLITDHIQSVEMVTVNAQGNASVVTATRNGTNSDL